MTDYEKYQQLRAEYEALLDDRNQWRRRCGEARRARNFYEEKAKAYAETLMETCPELFASERLDA